MMSRRRSKNSILRRSGPVVVLGALLLLCFPGCDMIIPPENETIYDNPQDPQSSTYVEPQTTILSGPANGSTIGTSTGTITYGGNEGATYFQWRLNGGNWSTWSESTSTTLEYLDELTYTFEVRAAYDPGSGNPTQIDASPALVMFTVDAVDGPSLRFSPPFYEAQRGIAFTLDIVAEEVTDLMAVKAVIEFDQSVLTALDVEEGNFFTSTGGSQALYYTIDQALGRIEVNIGTAAGSPAGVTGSGTIATLTFLGESQDEVDISFDLAETRLRDSDNQVITIESLVGARVRVQ